LIKQLSKALPAKMGEKIRSREDAGIPRERVTSLWMTTARERTRHSIGLSPGATFALLDPLFSRAAAHRPARTRSDLFLYSPYAWEAFTARYSHDPRKVLFQFHPHTDLERRILYEDLQKYPFVQESYEGDAGDSLDEAAIQRNRDCWRYADVI